MAATDSGATTSAAKSPIAESTAETREYLNGGSGSNPAESEPAVPTYLKDTYAWAYLHPFGMKVFDWSPVVSAILWGNYRRLKRAAASEIRPGQRVLQAACVYGDFSVHLAEHVGSEGLLDVIDVVPMQVENCARKLRGIDWGRVHLADATAPGDPSYDAVCCFFLLHELPEASKSAVINALLGRIRPGGKVIFVDYHKPHPLHPLKPITALIFRLLEPFATELWKTEIRTWADDGGEFVWRKETCFGGLFQKVTAEHKDGDSSEIRLVNGHS